MSWSYETIMRFIYFLKNMKATIFQFQLYFVEVTKVIIILKIFTPMIFDHGQLSNSHHSFKCLLSTLV